MELLRPRGGRRATTEHQRGSALVEFAVLTPLLIMLLVGGGEAAWLFSQQIDVRHAAREAGRMAATNFGDEITIRDATCQLMDDSTGVALTLAGSSEAVGGQVAVTVERPATTVTSLLDWAFRPGMTLRSTSTFLLEVAPVSWSDGGVPPC